VTPTRLRGQAITTNGTVFDTFELTKKDGQPPAEYFARVYPEDWLKLTFVAATNLTARLTATPGTDAAALAMFTLRAPRTTREPLALEIGLAPDSAPFYELPDGPLRVTTPAPGETNQVVWAKVRATGRKKITTEGSGRTLSPALIFQAKVRTAEVETVAYGQRCRVSQTATDAAKKLSP
jgi:hypothetical protein